MRAFTNHKTMATAQAVRRVHILLGSPRLALSIRRAAPWNQHGNSAEIRISSSSTPPVRQLSIQASSSSEIRAKAFQPPPTGGFRIHRITGDGSCMFRAIIQGVQMATKGSPMSVQSEATAAQNLRAAVVKELRSKKSEMEPFIAGITDDWERLQFCHGHEPSMEGTVNNHKFAFGTSNMSLDDMCRVASVSSCEHVDQFAQPSLAGIYSTRWGALLMQRMENIVKAQVTAAGPVKMRVVGVGVYGKVVSGDNVDNGDEKRGMDRVMSYPGASFRVVTAPEAIQDELIQCMNELDSRVEKAKDSIRFIGYCGIQLQMCQYNPLDYLSRMSHPAAWGGEPEMVMAVNVIRRPITVYRPVGTSVEPIVTYGEELASAASPVHLLWSGMHYDLLIPAPLPGANTAAAA